MISGLDRFRDTYLTESAELLSEMERLLVAYQPEYPDMEALNAIFRCAHSIKGGAGAFGFARVTGFTHKMESLLDAMRAGHITILPTMIDALLRAVDVTVALLKAESSGEAIAEDFGDNLGEEFIRWVSGGTPAAAAETAVNELPSSAPEAVALSLYGIHFVPHAEMFASGNDPLLILRELKGRGKAEIKVDVTRLPPLASYDPERCYLGWTIFLETDQDEAKIREVFEFVEDSCDLTIVKQQEVAAVPLVEPALSVDTSITPAKAPAASDKHTLSTIAEPPKIEKHPAGEAASSLNVTSIRVDIDKIDRLVNMVGELVITQAMLQAQTRILSVEEHPQLLRGVDDLAQHMRELQEAVMAVRMQPIRSVFARMPRIVRDIAQQTGKDIRLLTEGENTEVDKTIVEQLADPLMHMIRNAADHGIELPHVRSQAGKPEQGTIKLKAYHQGGQIIIEVSEDGAGLNHQRILQKAKEKGLIAPDADLTEDMIHNLIFLPGFSTAEKISNISGRGVGMDVVKRNITEIGGAVQVRSELGKGSCFTINLPLTLAILDGMIIRVGREHYIIPITSIIETLRPRREHVHPVPGASDVLEVRGAFISLVRLHRIFNIRDAEDDPTKALVVLVECGERKLGLVVDELIGQQQVVIKSLESNTDPVAGVSGATILGDGKVSLILDILGIGALMHAPHHSLDQRTFLDRAS